MAIITIDKAHLAFGHHLLLDKISFGIEKGANNHSQRENNYSSKPTTSFLRKEAEVVSTPSSSSSSEEANKSDIPSFLRRR